MGARGLSDPCAPLRIVPQLADPRGELRRIRRARGDAHHELSGMSRYVPVAETIVGTPATIAIESEPLTSPRCGKRRSTATSAATSQARKSSSETSWCTVTRSPTAWSAITASMSVPGMRRPTSTACTSGGNAAIGLDERREALGFIDVSGRDDHGAQRPGLERRPELARARLRAAHRRFVLHHGMRHHEDRRANADRLEVPLAELRVDHDPASGPRDGSAPHDPQRLVLRDVGIGHAAPQSRGLAGRGEPVRITRHLELPDEPVEREVVKHHEPGRGKASR